MLRRAGFRAVNAIWLASQRADHRAFRAALDRPAAVQAARLRDLLSRNAASDYGRRFDFDRIATPRDYQDAVPVVGADDLAPEIESIKGGRQGVLTTEPVVSFETSGGSTGLPKYIPYTASLLAEFRRALGAWVVDLYTERPALRAGGAYWSVSPAGRSREVTPGGIPVGFDDDAQYFGPTQRWALRRLLLTPSELAGIDDMACSRYVTLRFLLDSPDLAFLSVWNPSFLTLLVRALHDLAPRLVDDIERGTLTPPAPLPARLESALRGRLQPRPARARALRAVLARANALPPAEIWPRLRLISCWTDAASARFLPELEAAFPGVEVQGKGLLATEGVVSIPLVGQRGAAIAVTSHFYEFADAESLRARPRLAHELEVGRRYAVILTTGGGLYRYALGDTVGVVGHRGATPLVEFVGRTGLVSDLCGEKLGEPHVARALEAAAARLEVRCSFVLLAPEWASPPYYTLFAEAPGVPDSALARLAGEVERELLQSPSYAYCRRLGQLGAVRAFRVGRDATAAYVERCTRLGQRAGAVKSVVLHRTPGWSAHMPGVPV
ncbi:MAG: GH3 auxin-responsive promoter family protein [Candidatus Rokuibacteriota bacterium]